MNVTQFEEAMAAAAKEFDAAVDQANMMVDKARSVYREHTRSACREFLGRDLDDDARAMTSEVPRARSG